MSFLGQLSKKGKVLDEKVLGKLPQSLSALLGRYGSAIAIVCIVALLAGGLTLLNDGAGSGIDTSGNLASGDDGFGLGDGGGNEFEPGVEPDADAPEGSQARELAEAIASQVTAPKTANVCGRNGILDTGLKVQSPYAVQCVDTFSGDNGGNVSRGVFRNKIRVAWYYTTDPQIEATVAAGGGCQPNERRACWIDYVGAFTEWHSKYYQLYGREIELIKVEGSGRENNVEAAIRDARTIANLDPPVFAVLGGPGEAGPAFAEELKANGIVCLCTVSLPEEFYKKNYPYVFPNLMSSTQAYIHRSEYVGKRLARRKAQFAGAPAPLDPDLREKFREFALVWFDNTRGDYRVGVDFFEKQLLQYKDHNNNPLKLATKIRYENIEGCQKDAGVISRQLIDSGATSVIFSGDPICPISLTEATQAQQASFEWIITGSILTDSNNLARLYQRDQWSRAFGVSMLSPDVLNANDYWYKMWKEVRTAEPKEDAQLFQGNAIILFTAVHLAGPRLTPKTFGEGLAKAIARGGTPTVARRSYGPKKVGSFSFWDTTSFDDMTEIWWDNTASDANGSARAYRYVDGGKRFTWGNWPTSDVKAFNPNGTVTGYQNPPDQ